MIASMTGWDWFVLLVLVFSVAAGIWRGLVRTVFGLAGWVAALIGAPLTAPSVIAATGTTQYPWVAFVLLFLAILMGVRMLGVLLFRGMKAVGLGGTDRFLGALLGIARALVVITLAAIIARTLGLTDSEAWTQAWVRPLLDDLVGLLDPWLPEQITGIQRT